MPCVDRRGLGYPAHRYEGKDACVRCGKAISYTTQMARRAKRRWGGLRGGVWRLPGND